MREEGDGGRVGLEGREGVREEGDGGRVGLEEREGGRVSCEAGDKCLVIFSLVSCKRSEHS